MLAELHIRSVEHGAILGKVLVVSERVGALQNRSLRITKPFVYSEQFGLIVISPLGTIRHSLDRKLRLSIEDVTGNVNLERHARKRDVVILGRNLVICRIHFVNTFRREFIISRIKNELSRERIEALVRTIELDNNAIRFAFLPECVQHRRIR